MEPIIQLITKNILFQTLNQLLLYLTIKGTP